MIATPAILAHAERAVTVRPMPMEFFDALEASVHKYGGVRNSPAMVVVRDPSAPDDPRIEPRAFFGHLLHFASDLYEREPDLAQHWLGCALTCCDRLNLTPQLVAEAVVSYNMAAERSVETPLSWIECCAALGLRREDA